MRQLPNPRAQPGQPKPPPQNKLGQPKPPPQNKPGQPKPPPQNKLGQSTVELALVLPAVLLMLLLIAQFGLLVAQKVTLEHVSRETARAVAIHNSAEVAREAALAASNLAHDQLQVAVLGDTSPGGVFTVQISYRATTDLPLIGELLGDVTLRSQTAMRAEG